jgi:hypothetical protein
MSKLTSSLSLGRIARGSGDSFLLSTEGKATWERIARAGRRVHLVERSSEARSRPVAWRLLLLVHADAR